MALSKARMRRIAAAHDWHARAPIMEKERHDFLCACDSIAIEPRAKRQSPSDDQPDRAGQATNTRHAIERGMLSLGFLSTGRGEYLYLLTDKSVHEFRKRHSRPSNEIVEYCNVSNLRCPVGISMDLDGFIYQPSERELDYDNYQVNFVPGSMCVEFGLEWGMVEYVRRGPSLDSSEVSFMDMRIVPYGKQYFSTDMFRRPTVLQESRFFPGQKVIFTLSRLRRYLLDDNRFPESLDERTVYDDRWNPFYACYNLRLGAIYEVEMIVQKTFLKVRDVGIIMCDETWELASSG